MRVIIMGGVAGGMSAATRLRRLDEQAEIVIFERGPHVSFANCGLPYALGGVIEERQSLLLQTPESLAQRFDLDVRVNHEVLSIDREAHEILVADTLSGETRIEPYDALILSPGVSPVRLPSDDSVPVVALHTVPELDTMLATLDATPGTPVVVAGAGFIGLEVAENLVHRGIPVTLVQRSPQVLAPLDPEMAALLTDRLRDNGVDLRLSTRVDRIEAGEVVLSDGSTHRPAMVVNAIGVRPNTQVAAAAGLAIGPSGGIVVDAQQRTSDPAILAVGDAAEKVDAVDGQTTIVTLAGLANRHGRAAADTIAGMETTAAPALGTSVIGLFGLVAASTGWSERRLIAAGRAHHAVHIHPSSHAGYYPGATTLTLKLLVDSETDEILGAQAVGTEGAARRIDVIATAIVGGITASALSRLELAYAPQFGSAKDPVNQLGYVAEGRANGSSPAVQWHQLESELAAGALLIDVRSAGEFARETIPGATNIPVDDLRERHGELAGRRVIVHCQVGQRGHTATRLLRQLGIDALNLDGGFLTWKAGVRATATAALEGAGEGTGAARSSQA
ncbi:FAD-dependent oxidoreductase [Leucobacter sp. cx-87]|nr:FAD-dependent oxidoreductase [Leucobacter sp. cx-87]